MNIYDSASGKRRVWYDRHLRAWTMQNLDPEGNQVGEVDYTVNRKLAFDWLEAVTYDQGRLT